MTEPDKTDCTLLTLLLKLKDVSEDPKHHPEGNVYVHSLQCLELAQKESDDTELHQAALLHDLGKAVTGIPSKGHEKHSAELIKDYVSEKVVWLVAQHMRVRYAIDAEMRRGKRLSLMMHPWFPDLVRLHDWDKRSRRPDYTPEIRPIDYLELINGR